MENIFNFVSSKVNVDLKESLSSIIPDNVDTKSVAISAIGITGVLSIAFFIKKQYDYEKNMIAPNDTISKFESTSKIFECRNGSIIEYQEYGDPNGYPIVYFHGASMMHLEAYWHGSHERALSRGIRLIAVSRPGCGESKFPIKSFNDKQLSQFNSYVNIDELYPMSEYLGNDILQLLNKLDIKANKYGVCGASAGGLFAMSSIKYLKPRIISLTVGVPVVTQNDIINKTYDSVLNDQTKPWFIKENMNTFLKGRLEQYLFKIMSQYFKDTMIESVKKMHFNEYDDDKLNELAYIMGQSYKYGILGNMYGRQLLAGACGIDWNEIDNELKEESNLKIIMNMGQKDDFITPKWYNEYYNQLTNKYGFKNIELNDYDCGHMMNDEAQTKSFDILSNYIRNNNL